LNPEETIDFIMAQRVADWQYEVANGDTRLGFTEWLEHQIDAGFEEIGVTI
jgi:hypothetical protein